MYDANAANKARRPTWGVVILMLVTATGVFISSAFIIKLEPASPATRARAVDETTYYEYVAPRLDRLVVETDSVVEKVASRSRDVIGLSISGNRIETLAAEIISFGETNGVPSRFSKLHQLIIDGAGIATYTFGEARLALVRFDFSTMPMLVPELNKAAQKLRLAQGELLTIIGESFRALLRSGMM